MKNIIKKIKNFFKNIFKGKRKFISIPVILVLITAIIFAMGGEADESTDSGERVKKVSVLNLYESGSNSVMRINASGVIRASQEADLVAETSGVVASVSVNIGANVSQGQTLVSLSNSDLRARVAQAQTSLESQRAQLSDLQRSSAGGSAGESVKDQQDTLVRNAYKNLLNNDLQAYLTEQYEEFDTGAPIISGSYNSDEEGSYIIETYPSGSDTGVSFRYSGLEKGVQSVTTSNPVPLGERGLYITFPESAAKANRTWVINLPNKRSSTYSASLGAYDSAKRARDVALNSVVNEDKLRIQRSAVKQAEISLMAANAELAKTIIRAPFAGSVLSVTPKVGEYISVGSPAVSLLSNSGKEITFNLNSEDASLVQVGDEIEIGESAKGIVIRKAPGIDPVTGKVELIASITNEENPTAVGEFVSVAIPVGVKSGEELRLPLRSVRISADKSEVFTVQDGVVVAHPVQTSSLSGEYVTIESGLENIDHVIANVRGVREGDKVIIE